LVFTTLIRDTLPIGVVGLVFGGLIAAVMSTGDSILNTAAVVFTRDIYNKFINPSADDATLLKWSKLATLAVGFLGIFVTIFIPSVFDLMVYIFGLWAPSMIPTLATVILLGATPLERRISPYAGVPAILAGIITTVVWQYMLNDPYGIPGLIMGILANLFILGLVHLMTKDKVPTGTYIPENIQG
jgi:SSS family solute:Na+ symporter